MPLRLLLVLCALVLLGVPERAAARALPSRYVVPGEQVFPEGIAAAPRSPVFFVGSTTSGTIFVGHVRRARLREFLPGGQDERTDVRGLEVDRRGRLWAAGGATGRLFVYDLRSGRLLRRFETGAGGFINDQAVTRRGDAYFTDSRRPVIFRVSNSQARPTADRDAPPAEAFVDLTGSPIEYGPGFNLNGIVATRDDRALLTVQSNTGRLFRIDLATRAVTEVDLGGFRLTNGDGLVLAGNVLYVVRNANRAITTVALDADARSGTVVADAVFPQLLFPTTAAPVAGRLLVVESQLDRRGAGQPPQLPFTVAPALPALTPAR